jgi:hypothetical protein
MQTCYLAVDIGASSGRHIIGTVEHGVMALHEVYRFENRLIEKMQFQTFPEKESRPGRKTTGAPQLPYETGSVKIQRAFLTSAHLLETQYRTGKRDKQVFFH